MIGDGLSHVGFGSLAIAAALGFAPLALATPIVVLAAFLILRISSAGKIKGDSGIAMLSTGSLAIGVIVVSLSGGITGDISSYLFGSILAISQEDVYISCALCILVIVLFLCFYHKIFMVTFDENFARAVGIKAGLINMLIAFLTAITIVLGMRIMGAMLISSLIVFPALTAMRLFKTYFSVVLVSVIVALVCFFCGMAVSFYAALPSGAVIVVVNIAAFLIFSLIALVKKHAKIA
jgi:zinc transport system permease protein